MSKPPSEEGFPPSVIVVVDTSALIELKRIVPIARQWPLLSHMSELVASGDLCYPRQVKRELTMGKYPDAPGAWAAGHNGTSRHPDPSDESLAEVLGIAQLVDIEAEDDYEAADPYVAAMAYHIRETYPSVRVVVATNDVRDRMPVKEALATACRRLAIECWLPQQLLAWLETGELPELLALPDQGYFGG